MFTEKKLKEILPHGSGIDCTWEIEDKGKYFKASNSYHCMNETGYYVGYADFSLIIPKKDWKNFRLHFHGNYSHYLNYRFMLRNYLEDSFVFALLDFTRKHYREERLKEIFSEIVE